MKKLLLLNIPMLLSACAISPYQSLPKVSEQEFSYYFDIDKQAKQMADNLFSTQFNEEDHWENTQLVNCKIFASTAFRKEDPSVQFYWDGECKDGYAYGLGREFSIGKNTYFESIGSYVGGRLKPIYYYDYNEKNRIIDIKGKQINELLKDGGLEFSSRLDDNNLVNNFITYYDPKNKEVYLNSVFPQMEVGEHSYSSKGGLRIRFTDYNDPILKSKMTMTFDKKSVFSADVYQNGSGAFYDLRTQPPRMVQAPKNINSVLREKLGYLDAKIKNINDPDVLAINNAVKMADLYIKKTCASTNFIAEVGQKNYFEICTPYKSLNRLSHQIEQGQIYANQFKKQRLEEAERIAVQNRIKDEQFQQQRAQNQAGWLSVLQAVNEVSNTMATGYNQRANMYNNMSNSISQMPVPNIQPIRPQTQSYNRVGNFMYGSNGISYNRVGSTMYGSDGSQCTEIGNSIQCR